MRSFSILQMGRGSALNKRLFASFLLYHDTTILFMSYSFTYLYAISIMIIKIFGHVTKMSTLKTNLRKGHVRPAEIQIRLCSSPVRSQSSLSVQRYIPIFIYHKETTLIRLDCWPDWSESPLGAHATLLVCHGKAQTLHKSNDGTITIFLTQTNAVCQTFKR